MPLKKKTIERTIGQSGGEETYISYHTIKNNNSWNKMTSYELFHGDSLDQWITHFR